MTTPTTDLESSPKPSRVRSFFMMLRRGTRAWPLRARIVAVLAALLSVAMLAVGMAGSWQLRAYLTQRQDADLRAAAPTLITSAIRQSSIKDKRIPSYVPIDVYAFLLVTKNGVQRFYPAKGPRPDFGTVTAESVARHGGRPFTADSLDGQDGEWRIIEGIDSSTHAPYAVAVSLESAENVVTRMEMLTIIVSTLTLLTAIGAALFGVRRALRPLSDIEDTARAIASGDMSRRVPNPGTSDEIESLSSSLNVMLTQLEHSMVVKDRSEESMRRFVADASHELRTPLATVRGYAELYRQGAVSDPADIATGFKRIEDEARRMSDMVEDLLLLSRLETEQRAATVGGNAAQRSVREVDLTVLAGDAVADVEARNPNSAHGRRFRLRGFNGPLAPAAIMGDEPRLRQVVTNLVTNAERYSLVDTPVEVLVGRDGSDGVIAVIDHGPGIPEEIREHIFERFYRADVARNRAAGSTGLGLSIVAAIVDAHKGTIEVTDTPGGGATFTLRLPAHTESQHITDTH